MFRTVFSHTEVLTLGLCELDFLLVLLVCAPYQPYFSRGCSMLCRYIVCMPITSVFLNLLSELPLKECPCLFCESLCMKGIRGVYSLQQKRITKKSQVPGACISVCAHYSYQHNSIGKWDSDVFKRLFN